MWDNLASCLAVVIQLDEKKTLEIACIMSNNDTEFLSVDDVAKRLGVHRKTVLSWIHARELAAFDLGKGYKITEDDLKDFMKRRRVGPKPSGD